MRSRLVALDEEKVWWLLNLMIAITDAYNEHKPLNIEKYDANNPLKITEQIKNLKAQVIKHPSNTPVGYITDADGYSDEF